MKKVVNGIMKMFMCIVMAFIVFLTCCFIDQYADNIKRGYNEETAQKYAERRVEELYLNPITEWLESVSPKRKEVMEFPIANWNINWNTLVKPGQ